MQKITVAFRLQAPNGHQDVTIMRWMPCTLCTSEGDWQAYEDHRRQMEAEA